MTPCHPMRLLALAVWFFPLVALAAGYDTTVQWARRLELGLPVSGVIRSVDVDPGARVHRGQLLLALEDVPFRAVVEQAEARVTERRADRDKAARDYKQAKELYDRTVLSAVDLENARLKANRTEAGLKAAGAQLSRARYELDHSRITAPFDGWVLEVHAQPGQSLVNALEAHPLIMLAAQGEYEVHVRIPGPVVNGLKVGQNVNISVAGEGYAGRLRSIGFEPVAGKGGGKTLYEIGVVFTTQNLLRAGEPARVELP